MSDPTIFSQNTDASTNASSQAATQQVATQQVTPPLVDLLKEIRNPDGSQKFGDVTGLAKGYQHSQSFIQTLMEEKKQLEEQLNSYKSQSDKTSELERTVQELLQQRNQNTTTPVTPEQIAEMVNRSLDTRSVKEKQAANLATVTSTLQQAFGADAETKFYGKAAELGMSREEINALAAQNPKATFQLLGITQTTTHQHTGAPKASTVNAAGFQPNQDSYIGRNKNKLEVGATHTEINEEVIRSKRMVEELEANGMSINDLTNPKNYFKIFK